MVAKTGIPEIPVFFFIQRPPKLKKTRMTKPESGVFDEKTDEKTGIEWLRRPEKKNSGLRKN